MKAVPGYQLTGWAREGKQTHSLGSDVTLHFLQAAKGPRPRDTGDGAHSEVRKEERRRPEAAEDRRGGVSEDGSRESCSQEGRGRGR